MVGSYLKFQFDNQIGDLLKCVNVYSDLANCVLQYKLQSVSFHDLRTNVQRFLFVIFQFVTWGVL